MKKIIALKGVANVGKSDTIRKVYELLLKRYPNAKIECRNRIFRIETNVVLIIDGVKIGIESKGDPSSNLPKKLDAFKSAGCQVIICATRSKGQTVDAVLTLAKLEPKYGVLWIEQVVVPEPSKYESTNRGMAKQIVVAVEKVLHTRRD